MLEKDVPWESSIEGLKLLSGKYEIVVISSRTTDLQEKTLEVMKKLGFPLDHIHIFFKQPNEVLHSFRKNCILQAKEKNPSGVAICLNPDDGQTYENFDYTPIGFTSLKEYKDFDGKIKAIFQDWGQMATTLFNA
jgi:hypothetical protein